MPLNVLWNFKLWPYLKVVFALNLLLFSHFPLLINGCSQNGRGFYISAFGLFINFGWYWPSKIRLWVIWLGENISWLLLVGCLYWVGRFSSFHMHNLADNFIVRSWIRSLQYIFNIFCEHDCTRFRLADFGQFISFIIRDNKLARTWDQRIDILSYLKYTLIKFLQDRTRWKWWYLFLADSCLASLLLVCFSVIFLILAIIILIAIIK